MNDIELVLAKVLLCTLGFSLIMPILGTRFRWRCGGVLEFLWWLSFVIGVLASGMFILEVVRRIWVDAQ